MDSNINDLWFGPIQSVIDVKLRKNKKLTAYMYRFGQMTMYAY